MQQYIHVFRWTFPATKLQEIDWCSQVEDQGTMKRVITVCYENDGLNEVCLCPEEEEDLEQIYGLLDLTGYTGKICNLVLSEFIKRYPRLRTIKITQ